MDSQINSAINGEQTTEIKQTFLSNAISDIAIYIQLADTKVSIIMGSLVALLAGILSCYESILQLISKIKPCSWLGTIIAIFTVWLFISFIAVFVFGILTIRGHVSKIGYQSKWFLANSPKEYSFDTYKQDINAMTDQDIIENMAAELYKLNDINQQKTKTMKWVIRSFASTLIAAAVLGFLLLSCSW